MLFLEIKSLLSQRSASYRLDLIERWRVGGFTNYWNFVTDERPWWKNDIDLLPFMAFSRWAVRQTNLFGDSWRCCLLLNYWQPRALTQIQSKQSQSREQSSMVSVDPYSAWRHKVNQSECHFKSIKEWLTQPWDSVTLALLLPLSLHFHS